MLRKLAPFLVTAIAVGFVAGTPVVGANPDSHNPRGNNGFIKINSELTSDNIPNNHPHVSCSFSVDFYNYDKGDYRASVDFRLQSPTATSDHSLTVTNGNLQPFIGGDVASGGKDLDASEKYRLSFTGSAHPRQGYHVKVTISAPGSAGSDNKYKVFWVEPCTASTASTASTPQVLGTPTVNSGLPSELPATGGELLPALLVGAVAAGLAYRLHYRYNKQRA